MFKTFKADDLLFVEYKCLIEEEASDIWSHHNYFAHVIGSRKKWKTRKNEYLVSSGETLFAKKGANAVYQYFDEQFLVLFIFISDKFIQCILSKHHKLIDPGLKPIQSHDSVFQLSPNQILDSFFQSLLSYFLLQEAPHPEILKLKIEELILNILSHSNNVEINHYFLQLGHQHKVDIEQIMRSYFNYPLTIIDYAPLCARSLSSFRRDFKAIFKTTPAKWLIRERLAFSRFLLDN